LTTHADLGLTSVFRVLRLVSPASAHVAVDGQKKVGLNTQTMTGCSAANTENCFIDIFGFLSR
jgi:hypothetical protein